MQKQTHIIFLFLLSMLQFTNFQAITLLDFMNDFMLMYAEEHVHSKAEWVATTTNRKDCFWHLQKDLFYQELLIKKAINWINSDSLDRPDKTLLHSNLYTRLGLNNYANKLKITAFLSIALVFIDTAEFDQALSALLDEAQQPSAMSKDKKREYEDWIDREMKKPSDHPTAFSAADDLVLETFQEDVDNRALSSAAHTRRK
jgi:hypothetical protein